MAKDSIVWHRQVPGAVCQVSILDDEDRCWGLLVGAVSRVSELTLWVLGEAVGDNEASETATGDDVVVGALDGAGITEDTCCRRLRAQQEQACCQLELVESDHFDHGKGYVTMLRLTETRQPLLVLRLPIVGDRTGAEAWIPKIESPWKSEPETSNIATSYKDLA